MDSSSSRKTGKNENAIKTLEKLKSIIGRHPQAQIFFNDIEIKSLEINMKKTQIKRLSKELDNLDSTSYDTATKRAELEEHISKLYDECTALSEERKLSRNSMKRLLNNPTYNEFIDNLTTRNNLQKDINKLLNGDKTELSEQEKKSDEELDNKDQDVDIVDIWSKSDHQNQEAESEQELPSESPEAESEQELPSESPETEPEQELPPESPETELEQELPPESQEIRLKHELPPQDSEVRLEQELSLEDSDDELSLENEKYDVSRDKNNTYVSDKQGNKMAIINELYSSQNHSNPILRRVGNFFKNLKDKIFGRKNNSSYYYSDTENIVENSMRDELKVLIIEDDKVSSKSKKRNDRMRYRHIEKETDEEIR